MADEITEAPKRELTYGEKAVGLTFNHGEGKIHDLVHEAKVTMAKAIDQMDRVRHWSAGNEYPLGTSGERAALSTIAIRKLQSAQMDMVKAITWKD